MGFPFGPLAGGFEYIFSARMPARCGHPHEPVTSPEQHSTASLTRLEFPQILDRTINAAPMMGRTDRHCRYFLRGFSARMLLYTEMIAADALAHDDSARLLEFDPDEHPVALQLGGCDPEGLAIAARRGEQAGYDEINLNCGCPSDRTTGGMFGAYLMQRPEVVAGCVAAMRAAVRVPVTVKMRIGVIEGRGRAAIEASHRFDDAERAALYRFVGAVRDAGCDAVVVHARKAVLGGLSAQDNRKIPQLQYDVVSQVKREFPDLPVVVNGGLREPDAILTVLERLDGIMLGREAYQRPVFLARLDALVFGGEPRTDDPHSTPEALDAAARARAIERMERYTERQLARGEKLSAIVRHMQGLYAGEPCAEEFRRSLNEGARRAGAGAEVLAEAVASTQRR
jgi:tRNA-dihydrouridine synthase A